MKVKAKCTARAFDNSTSMLFEPGQVYEIEHDGQLASLKIGHRYVRFDKDGKPVGDPQGGKYVFEFDRCEAARSAEGLDAKLAAMGPLPERKYACKKCGEEFPSLNKLGTHSYSAHPPESEEVAEAETAEPETGQAAPA